MMNSEKRMMGMIDDIRKLLQDIVTPDLKALQVQARANDEASKARDTALAEKMDLRFQAVFAKMDSNQVEIEAKFAAVLTKLESGQVAADLKTQGLSAKVDANQAAVLNAMNIDKRVEAIERQTTRPIA